MMQQASGGGRGRGQARDFLGWCSHGQGGFSPG